MVVIAVIGILATVAINLTLQLTQRGHAKALESDLSMAYKAAVAYFAEHSEGTVTLDILKSHGYVQTDKINLNVVDGTEANLLITGTHPGVPGVYQVDRSGHITKQ